MTHLRWFQLFLLLLVSCAFQTKYPESWWTPVSADGAPEWEILPQAAKPKEEVILSKRNELGILSNFAATPFFYLKKRYASVEGFWQMMKYPDPELKNDPRNKVTFPFSREQVAAMIKKLRYNREFRRVLLATGQLKLKPDHTEGECHAPEWKYYELWMDIRKDVMRGKGLANFLPH